MTATIARLSDLTQSGDDADYVDIALFMADLPLRGPSSARWLEGEQPTRERWHALVTARRDRLNTAR
ncbi:hypothetical protein [Actinacidiphila soli]|jgi:hypothetical protein|uniref:hypothetical protein n=1 Tax=Actinacidiphila soli TaxID=2487275 RepID=UPI000FCA6EC7|nr:hypothetical protein [Actinacidiphila soli]